MGVLEKMGKWAKGTGLSLLKAAPVALKETLETLALRARTGVDILLNSPEMFKKFIEGDVQEIGNLVRTIRHEKLEEVLK